MIPKSRLCRIDMCCSTVSGTVCSRNLLLRPAFVLLQLGLLTGAAALTYPKIYLYDLPEHLTSCWKEDWELYNYGAELRIVQALQQDGKYITNDPKTADLFLVPALLYCIRGSSNLTYSEPGHLRLLFHQTAWQVVDEIRKLPYFDVNNGRDHIFIFTHDNGFCGFTHEGTPDILQHAIILTHWGLTSTDNPCRSHDWIDSYEACRQHRTHRDSAGSLPCYVPDKDIVIPHVVWDQFLPDRVGPLQQFQEDFLDTEDPIPGASVDAPPLPEHMAPLPGNKRRLFFFIGETHEEWPRYSHGVRQAVLQLNTTPGFAVHHTTGAAKLSHEDVRNQMHASLFCLAPTGSGWGVRLKQAAMSGCIPVIIDDHVRMEYEDLLPFSDFTIRVPQSMIYRLPVIFEQLLEKQRTKLELMLGRQACAASLLSWASNGRGRALEVLMCGLAGKWPAHHTTYASVNWELCKITCEATWRS